jgi:hypothetical protein
LGAPYVKRKVNLEMSKIRITVESEGCSYPLIHSYIIAGKIEDVMKKLW